MRGEPWGRSRDQCLRNNEARRVSLNRKLLILLLFAPLLGLLGVVVAELVPDGRIANHLVRADQAGLLDPLQRSTSPLGTQRDQGTECTVLGIGLGDPAEMNSVESALMSPGYDHGCEGLDEQLHTLEQTGELPPSSISYLRYWHGYTVITRPAVGILGLAGARWIVFALLLGSITAMAAPVSRSLGTVTSALLVLPTMLTTDMILSGLSLPQAIGISTAWVGGSLAFILVRRSPSWTTAALAAALGGAVSAYLDLMTTMPGALGLAAAGASLGACAAAGSSARKPIWHVTVAAGIGWISGLTWMWMSKWVLAATVVGVDSVYDNVRSRIAFRLSGENATTSPSRVRGFTKNIGEWWSRPLTPWVIIAALVLLVALAARNRRGGQSFGDIALCCAAIAVPVVAWFLVLNNHTQIHEWLVYRALPLAFGGMCATIWAMMSMPRNQAERLPRRVRTTVRKHNLVVPEIAT